MEDNTFNSEIEEEVEANDQHGVVDLSSLLKKMLKHRKRKRSKNHTTRG